MISLNKNKKPAILALKEEEWTKELMSYVEAGTAIPDYVSGRYRHKEIKEALLAETNHKCAYCESMMTHVDYGDIEHILPKSKFGGQTFLWENLTMSCSRCNTNKEDYYEETMPLLNPYEDEPERRFKFLGPVLFAVPGDERAEFTILKLKLSRPELYERRREHLERLRPMIREYEKTTDLNYRMLLLQDIKEMASSEKEFSLMTKQVLDELKITG